MIFLVGLTIGFCCGVGVTLSGGILAIADTDWSVHDTIEDLLTEPWRCNGDVCGATNAGLRQSCWSCGMERPEAPRVIRAVSC